MVIGVHAFNFPRNGGAIGVGFFFVLSGFLITSLLLKEYQRDSGINLRHFYARRALRLFPLLYLALAAVAVSVFFIRSPAERTHVISSLVYCAGYIGDFYGFVTRSNALARSTGHFWSLAVEEQFYLLWPAALLLVMRRRGEGGLLRFIAVGMVAAVAIRMAFLGVGKSIWTLPTTHADALLAGCGVSVLLNTRLLQRTIQSPHVQRVGVAVLVVSLGLPTLIQTWPGGVGYLVIEGFGVVLLLCALSDAGPVRALLRLGPLVYCGRISYGLYVIHTLVNVAIAANLAGGKLTLPWALISIVVTLLLAAASWRWYESYFLRIKDRRFAHKGPVATSGAHPMPLHD